MYDPTLVRDILTQISYALQTIETRFTSIAAPNDFTDNPHGKEKLDGICMLLMATGESLKQIDKITDKKLFEHYPNVDWKGAKGMRDIIAHHYFDVNANEIFFVCENKLPDLQHTIEKMIHDLNPNTGATHEDPYPRTTSGD